MPLAAGTRLGPYEILEPIGAGGMGEVFKARDTRLNRIVAIKLSKEQFTERFEREAKAIAALNHPNVCTLHDVGPNYLVMEYVEGSTLSERLKEGLLPEPEAYLIARQIANAVEAAHEKGIVHRDLKPGNVKLKPDGTVKVLDFGLAKVGGTPTLPSDDSPTITIEATRAGVILGTASYMAPEQARGKPVDKRADIWAFGVVLYEMLTGEQLFAGETVTDTLAKVLEREPQWERVPPRARLLLRRCLVKDPKQRLHDMHDAMLLLDEEAAAAAPAAQSQGQSPVAWALTGVCLAALAVVTFLYFRPAPAAPAEPIRFQVTAPPKNQFGLYFSLSPDGRRLAFMATGEDGRTRLWVRAVDSVEARALPGTENAGNVTWSPDSRFLLFRGQGGIRKVDASGDSPPQMVVEGRNAGGALGATTWNQDGVILIGGFGTGAIRRVAATGGEVTAVTKVDTSRKETQHAFPFFLPDGKHFLYLRLGAPDLQGIYTGSLDVKPEEQSNQRLLTSRFEVRYVPLPNGSTGHLIFQRESTLMAQPFDPGKLELSGEPVPIAENLGSFGAFGFFSTASNGALAFRTGPAALVTPTWFDRRGNSLGAATEPGTFEDISISPDGKQFAAALAGGGSQAPNIWLVDFARRSPTRFTFAPSAERFPVWSPDGSRIVFVSTRSGRQDLYVKAANFASDEQLVLESSGVTNPSSWSSDGRFLLYGSSGDLILLPVDGDKKPVPWLRTMFTETNGRFSPDGHWIAYNSDESGTQEVYVRPFVPPQPGSTEGTPSGGKWPVSRNGGNQVRWRRDGKELFFRNRENDILAVDVTTNPTFQVGDAKVLFRASGGVYDVSGDGQRFLVDVPTGNETPAAITVVLNRPPGLRAK